MLHKRERALGTRCWPASLFEALGLGLRARGFSAFGSKAVVVWGPEYAETPEEALFCGSAFQHR